MSDVSLGRLAKVNMRDVWPNEAHDFTSWLAREENLALLGETIGIDLELVSQEQNVGPFRADILCKDKDKDLATDAWVLIENQLERTDHNHLGQLLTYAAGLNAVTIVWIANRFTDEHRAALDWLNKITDEGVNFFGLEIELWRIGTSPPAPKFNIISRPNDWSKTLVEVAKRGDLTPIEQRKFAFWTEFRLYLQQNSTIFKPGKAHRGHWMNFYPFHSGAARISTIVNTKDEYVRVELVLRAPDAKENFAALQSQQAEIEQVLGPLDWRLLPGNKRSTIALRNMTVNPNDETQWPAAYAWLCHQLHAFYEVFGPRVKALPAMTNSGGSLVEEISDEDEEND